MEYVKQISAMSAVAEAGACKTALPVRGLLLRGALSGGILAIATSLAVATVVETNLPIVATLLFPAVFVMIILRGWDMIILHGLDMVTGSFAFLPMAQMDHKTGITGTFRNWAWVFLGNLLGSMLFAMLLWIVLTMMGASPAGEVGDKIVALAEAKTLTYASHGSLGWITAFGEGVLCNWIVCLGVAMGMLGKTLVSKLLALWLPITLLFGHGFEHAIVNMFLIPAGILLGAKVTLGSWWLWNQIPVTLGNLVGGFLFTGLALYRTYRTRAANMPAMQSEPELF